MIKTNSVLTRAMRRYRRRRLNALYVGSVCERNPDLVIEAGALVTCLAERAGRESFMAWGRELAAADTERVKRLIEENT